MSKRLTKAEKEEIARLVRECNEPKSRLIALERAISKISPLKANSLGSVIGRLESWQNKTLWTM